MAKATGARILLTIGFLAASISYSAWWVSRTVLDAGATETVAQKVLATDAVQEHLQEQLNEQVAEKLDEAQADPRVARAVTTAMRDPRVVQAFAEAVRTAHEALLSDSDEKVVLDVQAVTGAVHEALLPIAPDLAAQLEQEQPLRQEIDPTQMPKLGGVDNRAHTAFVLGAIVALLCITLSLLLAHDRKSVGRAGRRLAYLAFVPLLLFLVAPPVLDGQGDMPTIIAAGARGYSGRVVPSAIVLVVLGVAVALSSRLLANQPTPEPLPPAPRPPQPDGPPSPYGAAPTAPPTRVDISL